MLVRAGADVNRVDNRGRSPLKWACGNGELIIAECLLRCGARVDEEWVVDEQYDEDDVASMRRVRAEVIESMGGPEGVCTAHAEWLSTMPGRRIKAKR